MKSVLNLEIIYPIALLIVQAFLFLFLGISLLRKMSLLKTPYAGMDFGTTLISSSVLFGILLISTADVGAMFQAFSSYQNAGGAIFNHTLTKFSQFFLIVFFACALFLMTAYFLSKFIMGIKSNISTLGDNDLPGGILISVLLFGFAIIIRLIASELITLITPQFVNFR